MRRLTLAAALHIAAAAAAAEPVPTSGSRLFHEGVGAQALLADGRVRVPATSFACAGCHGADGRGRREGGTVFPPLAWSALADPARPGGAYTAASLGETLATGVAPGGRRLGAAMPRYEIAPEIVQDLAAFLVTLNASARVGVTGDEIRLAPPLSPEAAAAFRAALDDENAAGGVWGRRLVVSPTGAALLSAAEARTALAPALDQAFGTASGLAANEVIEGVGSTALRALREALPTPDERLGDTSGSPPRADDAAQGAATTWYVVGAETAVAALSCGRGVTRACILERLAQAQILDRLVAPPADP